MQNPPLYMYDRVLNMPWVLILNIPWVLIWQDYTGFWICLNNSWTCLDKSEYVLMCLNLPEWLLVYFPIVIPYIQECMVIYFNVYAKLEVIVWMIMRLFSWSDEIWFFSIIGCFWPVWVETVLKMGFDFPHLHQELCVNLQHT